MINDHKFIFICGLHRSGTSILYRSLRDHPQISGFENTRSPEDEGMHLQSVYHPSGYYGGAGKFGFNPLAHLTEDSMLVSDANRQKLFSQWRGYWNLNKPFLLEKSPPNLIRTRFFQAMFPQSYFIIVMRHPLAVTYATRAWYKHFKIYWRRFSRILDHWLVCHDLFMQDRKFLKNAIQIKYETFVSQPDASLAKIFEKLELEKHTIHQQIRPHVNKKYFSMWEKDRVGIFSKFSTDRLIAKYEKRFNSYGYSLKDLSMADPSRLELMGNGQS